jgi:hypothetical protein
VLNLFAISALVAITKIFNYNRRYRPNHFDEATYYCPAPFDSIFLEFPAH